MSNFFNVAGSIAPYAGAAIGSVVPGVGTGIGFGIGSLAGAGLNYFGGKQEEHEDALMQHNYGAMVDGIRGSASPLQQQGWGEWGKEKLGGIWDWYKSNPLGISSSLFGYNIQKAPSWKGFSRGGGLALFPMPYNYAKGGDINTFALFSPEEGLIEGEDEGQEDNFEDFAPRGTYIVDATALSLLGDGNTKAGAKKLQAQLEIFDSASKDQDFNNNYNYNYITNDLIPIKVSAGEYKIPPEKVAAVGNGNLEKGIKKLDKMSALIKRKNGLNSGARQIFKKSGSVTNYLRLK